MARREPKEYFDQHGNLIIKPYRLSDLAAIFDVNYKTMRRWIGRFPDQLGERDGHYFSIQQVSFCIEKFGLPQKITVIIPMTQTKAA